MPYARHLEEAALPQVPGIVAAARQVARSVMTEFRMPSLGADMDRGTVVEWRVRPGDAVHRGDIVAVVDTDKSDIDVEIFEDGVIEELLVEPGRAVPVGTVLARVGPVGAGTEAPVPGAAEPARQAAPTAAAAKQTAPSRPDAAGAPKSPVERLAGVAARPGTRRCGRASTSPPWRIRARRRRAGERPRTGRGRRPTTCPRSQRCARARRSVRRRCARPPER